MKRLLNISGSEIKILHLLKKSPMTSKELSKALKKNISTVNRYLNKLIDYGFVYKSSRCCTPKRGRYFVYYLQDEHTLMEAVNKNVEEIQKNARKFFDKLFSKEI